MTTKGTALITGASTGIGAIYADRLAVRGYDLILVARNRDKLQMLASAISDKTNRAVEVLAADLGNIADLAGVEKVLREDNSITALVNNAGIGTHTTLLESDVDRMEAMVRLNVTALMRLTYAAVPGFVARGGGTVINIASIVAVAPELLNGVYGGQRLSSRRSQLRSTTNFQAAASAPRLFCPARHGPILGSRRPAGRASSHRNRDAGGRHGRCRACRARSGRNQHNPRASGYRFVERL